MPSAVAAPGRRRPADRIGIVMCWLSGAFLLAVTAYITLWLAVRGLGAIDWGFLTSDAATGTTEEGVKGGIRSAIFGTFALVAIGTAIALPIGVGTAIYLSEYRRPEWLARVVESSIEVVFGVPSIVFALFGVAIFTHPELVFLSDRVGSSGLAYGKSFVVAGIVMSMLAMPLVVRSTQEAMRSVSQIQREASYALGKSRVATIRRIVLPQSRAGIATGTILGVGRIAGDTAIVWLLLGGLSIMTDQRWYAPGHWADTLRGTGGTLTSYTYYASPAGDGNAADKAYGAAFVLIVLIVLINAAVSLVANRTERKPR